MQKTSAALMLTALPILFLAGCQTTPPAHSTRPAYPASWYAKGPPQKIAPPASVTATARPQPAAAVKPNVTSSAPAAPNPKNPATEKEALDSEIAACDAEIEACVRELAKLDTTPEAVAGKDSAAAESRRRELQKKMRDLHAKLGRLQERQLGLPPGSVQPAL